MGIAEKKGSTPVFDTDILTFFFFFFFFLPTAEIIAWLTGKISNHLPAAEGLKITKSLYSYIAKYFVYL